MSRRDIVDFVIDKRKALADAQRSRHSVWQDCQDLYDLKGDFAAKQDWQSKIVLPKAFAAVKQATSSVSQMLRTAEQPWTLEPVDPDNLQDAAAGSRLAMLLKFLFDESGAYDAMGNGLETAFLTGLGVWRTAWSMQRRQLPPRVNAFGAVERPVVMEGGLAVREVDPFGFFWLPGSRLNAWTGCIEDYEAPVHELRELVKQLGLEDSGVLRSQDIVPSGATSSDARNEHRSARDEWQRRNNAKSALATAWVTEYWGPLVDGQHNTLDGGNQWHILIVGDRHLLVAQRNQLWSNKPPYTAFSPMRHPRRPVDGIGVVEPALEINKAISRITNMGIDRELLAILPTMLGVTDAFENPEDLDAGITPGKLLRISRAAAMQMGGNLKNALQPLEIGGLSPQTVPLLGILDRAVQEGSQISEIQQALPRFRGAQTLGEIEMKGAQGQDFMSSLAKRIDEVGIQPLVEQGMDLTLQFLHTIGDKRAARILGFDDYAFWQSTTLEERLQIVQCDCVLKVHGVSDQAKKSEQLQELMTFFTVIGQNGEAWLPNINQGEILKRIIESFNGIRDVDKLINSPEEAAAIREQMQQAAMAQKVMEIQGDVIKAAASSEAAAEAAQVQRETAQAAQQRPNNT